MRVPLRLARAVVFLISRPIGPPTPVRLQRLWLELMSSGGVLPRGTTVEHVTVAGLPAERVVPAGVDESHAVLLLHGGGFVIGSPRTHRVLAGHLAAAAGVPVVTLHYRRSPEHPWPAAVDDAVAAYRELSARGPTAVFGDSAGGCVALLAALRLRDSGKPRRRSPWSRRSPTSPPSAATPSVARMWSSGGVGCRTASVSSSVPPIPRSSPR